jgi:hypothetical protein
MNPPLHLWDKILTVSRQLNGFPLWPGFLISSHCREWGWPSHLSSFEELRWLVFWRLRTTRACMCSCKHTHTHTHIHVWCCPLQLLRALQLSRSSSFQYTHNHSSETLISSPNTQKKSLLYVSSQGFLNPIESKSSQRNPLPSTAFLIHKQEVHLLIIEKASCIFWMFSWSLSFI